MHEDATKTAGASTVIGEVVMISIPGKGLRVECEITETTRINDHHHFKVTPIAGAGSAWVSRHRIAGWRDGWPEALR